MTESNYMDAGAILGVLLALGMDMMILPFTTLGLFSVVSVLIGSLIIGGLGGLWLGCWFVAYKESNP